MSFVKARQRSSEEMPISYSDRCAANGCQLRGTMSASDGKYLCSYHFSSISEKWPLVTESIRQNERITLAMDEVNRIGDIDWCQGKWEMLADFFNDEPEMQPSESEQGHRRWYLYRLHAWMLYMTGVTSRRPIPREPLKIVGKRGNASSFYKGKP